MDYSKLSMHDLFRMEAETSLAVLSDGVLQLNARADDAETLKTMMRAAHSLKGAARVVQLSEAVSLAHQMEDAMVAMQEGRRHWHASCAAPMLRAIDALQAFADQRLVDEGELAAIHEALQATPDAAALSVTEQDSTTADTSEQTKTLAADTVGQGDHRAKTSESSGGENEATVVGVSRMPANTHVRISPEHIERMIGLATEIQSEWQWLQPLNRDLQQFKQQTREALTLLKQLEGEQSSDPGSAHGMECGAVLARAQSLLAEMGQRVQQGLIRLEQYDRSVFRQSHQLHALSIDCRMQPFAHGIQGLKRMVHELAVEMGKQVQLHIEGEDILVDRDILEKIQAPLQHLLRNAVDHGIGDVARRQAAGKSAEGHIKLMALHQSGMLKVIVEDDGAGVDLEQLRQCVIRRGHASTNMVERMEKSELLAFLFLPGFSMREMVSEVSGRGVGLDVVEMTVRDIQGVMHVDTEAGKGTRFELHLPVSLAVTRVLHVHIGEQSWAVPLARLQRMMLLNEDDIRRVEGQPVYLLDDHPVGLVQASAMLGGASKSAPDFPWDVLLLGQYPHTLGLVVDHIVGIRDLVEKPLLELLGKVQDIAACAVLPDGQLIYVMNTQDMLRSMTRFLAAHRQQQNAAGGDQVTQAGARILVAEDSITVRETERHMLMAEGYGVDVAVDGVDAWNMLNAHEYDLLVSDVDMPNMDGITLIRRMRQDSRFSLMPVIIVSYKENERDRMLGLEAGADAYLAKSSFDDQSMLRKIRELLGEL